MRGDGTTALRSEALCPAEPPDWRRSFAERIARLERENRRLRFCGAVLLLGALAAGLMGQARQAGAAKPGPVEASEFVLRDAKGRERGWWGLLDGAPRILLYDENRSLRLGISLAADGTPGVVFNDRNNRTRLSLREEENTVGLTVRDGTGQVRAQLGVDERGNGRLRVIDARGKESKQP